MTVVKAAAVQISPVLYSRDGTVEKVVHKVAELGRQGVQFATFPETVVPYYPYFSFVQRPLEIGVEQLRLLDQAVTIPSAATHAVAWLDADQQAQIMADTGSPIGPISGGSFTAIVSPLGELLGEPIRSGEGEVIADLDFSLIDKRKSKMDSSGHYSRPELLLSLLIDHTATANMHERVEDQDSVVAEDADRVRL